jgi:hypothetical protein
MNQWAIKKKASGHRCQLSFGQAGLRTWDTRQTGQHGWPLGNFRGGGGPGEAPAGVIGGLCPTEQRGQLGTCSLCLL